MLSRQSNGVNFEFVSARPGATCVKHTVGCLIVQDWSLWIYSFSKPVWARDFDIRYWDLLDFVWL